MPPASRAIFCCCGSDVPVAATVGLTDSTEKLGDDYVGTSEPASVLSFPLIYRNFSSYTSQLVVQNASTGAQTVNISFFKQGSTTASATDSATIQPNSYKIFDMASYSGFGDDFGGAVVTGSHLWLVQPLPIVLPQLQQAKHN